MIANSCGLSEAFNRIVSECYPVKEARTKIRCAEFLSEYCQKKRIGISLADENFFTDYFIKWLPYQICRESPEIIKALYPSADEYVRLTDMLNGGSVYKRFCKMTPEVRQESERLLMLKRSIMEYNNSFILSKMPFVADFDLYKLKRPNSEITDRDRGRFRVESIFSKNSVVLSRINGYEYYIRLYFNSDIISLISENDIFDINVVRSEGSGRWILEDINGCLGGKSFSYGRRS
ncbi:hypothetical protein IMSAG049_01026 [Clostridiales bacterium]|nr:hypothetical protein IMSAG049_01026 [Clostridiales bacterium]